MKRGPKLWHSQTAIELRSKYGTATVEEAVIRLVDEKLSALGGVKPPVNLELVASRFNIEPHFNYTDLPPAYSARIRPNKGKYVVDVNRRHNRGRQRFSVAHEIAHRVLAAADIRRVEYRSHSESDIETREREELCDLIATLLLGLRSETLLPITGQYGITLRAVGLIADYFDVSFETAVRAMLRYSHRMSAVLFCVMHGGLIAGKARTFRVERCYETHGFEPTIAKGCILQNIEALSRAMSIATKIVNQQESLTIENMTYEVEIQAKQMQVYVAERSELGVVALLSKPMVPS
jgi:hypothetical protein